MNKRKPFIKSNIKRKRLPTFEGYISETSTIGGESIEDVANTVYDKLPDSAFNWAKDGDNKDDKLHVGEKTNADIKKILKDIGLPFGKANISRIRAAINRGMK